MVVIGSLSKTAVNGAAGAPSEVSELVCAALTVVPLLLTRLFEDLLEATLAAVVIAAVIELVDIPALRPSLAFTPGRSAARTGGNGPTAETPTDRRGSTPASMRVGELVQGRLARVDRAGVGH
jgi:Sulfate permease family